MEMRLADCFMSWEQGTPPDVNVLQPLSGVLPRAQTQGGVEEPRNTIRRRSLRSESCR
jgi:hypothetical protein